ncbi:MAG: TIGR03862 family flavoprotein [Rhodocyclales bacterium]|nr:TIGR03862 family flavoprotein [Rhodocyclales bacterium]
MAVAVIGGGPAGLMAAEVLSQAGMGVDVFDAMPSVGRKFLMAGKGGLNLSHAEPREQFVARYGDRRKFVEPWLAKFGADELRAWASKLGIETYVGSSGRIFPIDMKAAPLLRAWLHRLRASGVKFHARHRWLGWNADGALRFATPGGETSIRADAVVLALGGGSWAKLGSDGAWVPALKDAGIAVAPLKPANCGFDVAWSDFFRNKFAGEPVKSVAASFGSVTRRGEFVVTGHGVEGGLVYALSAPLRDAIEAHGHADLEVDLLPDRSLEQVATEVAHPRGARSLSSHLQSRLGLKGVKVGMLHECVPKEEIGVSPRLTSAIKALRLRLVATRPIDEAISTAGGVRFEALDEHLMLRDKPGVFCAGEMLDWEAPTGGYLLTACFASGRRAGDGVLDWLASRR